MKKLLLLFAYIFAAVFTQVFAEEPKNHAKYIRRLNYRIEQRILGSASVCSATAVGPRALLTASHCQLPTPYILVDGAPDTILHSIQDGNDHSLLILTKTRFPVWAKFATRPPLPGDAVAIAGSPGTFDDLYREGHTSGFSFQGKDPIRLTIIFSIDGSLGDSGAGVFNSKGELAGVISIRYRDGTSFSFLGAFLMFFTQEDLAKIQQ